MFPVGLSNILDSELRRRKPGEWPHGEIVGAAVMDGELLCEVIQGIKAVAGVKAFLILPVTALHLSVMTWRIRANEFVANTELGSGSLK